MPSHALLYFKSIIIALCVIIAGCSSPHPTTAGTWRAWVNNGDKPGIGIELTREEEAIHGRVFLLDPNRPGDFAGGSPRTMQIHSFTDAEIRFGVDWLPNVHNELVLHMKAPLKGDRVTGVLESVDHSGSSSEYEFVRIK